MKKSVVFPLLEAKDRALAESERERLRLKAELDAERAFRALLESTVNQAPVIAASTPRPSRTDTVIAALVHGTFQ